MGQHKGTPELVNRIARKVRADTLRSVYLDWLTPGAIAWAMMDGGGEGGNMQLLELVGEAILDRDTAALTDMHATFTGALTMLQGLVEL